MVVHALIFVSLRPALPTGQDSQGYVERPCFKTKQTRAGEMA